MLPLLTLSMLALVLLVLLVLSFFPAYFILPRFIRKETASAGSLRMETTGNSSWSGIHKMTHIGNVGVDVNKTGKPMTTESGVAAPPMSFSTPMFSVAGTASPTIFRMSRIGNL